MNADVEDWCKNCKRCVLAKTSQPKVNTAMGSLLATKPLEVLEIYCTILEKASGGRENVLVMTDVFTRMAHAVPTRDQKASTVAQVSFQEWFLRYGVPVCVECYQSGDATEPSQIALPPSE